MNRLLTHTRGLCSWRDRLADPERQWKRGYSAFETAVAWETASSSRSGLPEPIAGVLKRNGIGDPVLLHGVAEHKVDLPGGNAASQCDVWAIVNTDRGLLSMSVEGKANEAFGNEILGNWLAAGKNERSSLNRTKRWECIRANLPAVDSYSHVRYQLLHRCAAAVIEAKRWGCPNAALIIQSFAETECGSSTDNLEAYQVFCAAMNLSALNGVLAFTRVGNISLCVAWVDCPVATDAAIAACA